MNSFAFVVLVAFVAFASGANSSTLKVFSSLKSTRDYLEDLVIINAFVLSCEPALAIYQSCTLENNYNADIDLTDTAEVCKMSRIEVMCAERGIIGGETCAGQENALAAVRRANPVVEEYCAAVGSSATSAVMGLFTLAFVTCVNLFH